MIACAKWLGRESETCTRGDGCVCKGENKMIDIITRLREVPTMGHDAGCVEEAALEIEKLRDELKRRDKCAFMGPMRDCHTHGEGE